jgi:antitoxin ParD1/3/4
LPQEDGVVPRYNVVLTDHQHALVEGLVASGRYRNAGEIMREGLRLVEQRERDDTARLQALRAAVDVGLADVAAGRYIDVADDDLEPFIRQLGSEAAPAAEDRTAAGRAGLPWRTARPPPSISERVHVIAGLSFILGARRVATRDTDLVAVRL